MSIKDQSVEQIVEAIGGTENISTATHCITRLRFVLHDEEKVDKKNLESIDLVKGFFSANGQFQVIIGQGTVDKVYDRMVQLTGIGQATKQDLKSETEKKLNPLQKLVKTLGDIFIPILPAIVTSGLLMGIDNLLVGKGIFYANQSFIDVHTQWAGFSDIISLIANTSFTFLTGLIGWSAVKRFGGSPLLGIVLGLMLIHPELLNAGAYGKAVKTGTVPYWDLFGLHVNKIGYQGQVLPVLVSSFILAKLEKYLKKLIPDSFQLLIVGPLVLLITGFISFIVIGPITFGIGNGIAHAVVSIFNHFALLGGVVYAGINAFLVVAGMHYTFIPIDLQLIATTGATFLWPIRVMSNIAQGSAALAMMFVVKDEKNKSMSLTSAISAFLGVTEPAMFGVNIRFKFPFICSIIGAAIAGGLVAMFHVKAPSIGIGGLPAFLSITTNYWGIYLVATGIAVVVPFILTLAYGRIKNHHRQITRTDT